ncbi:hypothetical protein [Oceanithermus sp.]
MKKILAGALPLLLLALFTACGGSTGTEITVTVENYYGQQTLPRALAVQSGDGEWAYLPPDDQGNYSFFLPAGEKRYGVAVVCGSAMALSNDAFSVVLQLTSDDSTNPRVFCPGRGEFVYAKGAVDASAVTANDWKVYGPFDSATDGSPGSTGNYDNLEVPRLPNQDLVAVAKDLSGEAIAVKVARGVNVDAPFTWDATITATDAVGSGTVAAFTPPGGYSGFYSVQYCTSGGTCIGEDLIGNGDSSGGGFKIVPGSAEGDLYLFETVASAGDAGVSRLELIPAETIGNLSPGLEMAPFAAGYSPAASKRPVFPLNHPYPEITYYYGFYGSGYNFHTFMVSSGWLADNDNYTVPDLSALPGFSGLDLLSGEEVGWMVMAASGLSAADLVGPGPRIWLSPLLVIPSRAGEVLNSAWVSGSFEVP